MTTDNNKQADVATPPTSRRHMHTAYSYRRRCRGTYYKGHVLACVSGLAEKLGCSFSATVNLLLEKAIEVKLVGGLEDFFVLEVKRLRLLDEEAQLRRTMKVILRSGAYLHDYAERLILGDPKQMFCLKKRVGIYSHVNPKELNVILRILRRREEVVSELLDVEDQLLPCESYPFMVTERGWKLGEYQYTRDSFKRLKTPRKTDNNRQSKQQTGGECA